jgi:hypothetical protein
VGADPNTALKQANNSDTTGPGLPFDKEGGSASDPYATDYGIPDWLSGETNFGADTLKWRENLPSGADGTNIVQSREWDAGGHCDAACLATVSSYEWLAHLLGDMHEDIRDWQSDVGWKDHDSPSQDHYNQDWGRRHAWDYAPSCMSMCNTAYQAGQLDLTAPLTAKGYNTETHGNAKLVPVPQPVNNPPPGPAPLIISPL